LAKELVAAVLLLLSQIGGLDQIAVGDELNSKRQQDGDALLAAAHRGPREFTAFYRHFERPLLGFFMRATGRADLAADLMAETFVRALESVAGFDGDRGRADQWLFGIARNVLRESYRRGRVESEARERLGLPPLIFDDHAAEAIERLSGEDGAATLALHELPPEQRAAVTARVVDEADYPQIAADLACSEALIRQRVSRGLRSIRTRLSGER
jgi:RNA polymerase sigma factor (sigma-70 family)